MNRVQKQINPLHLQTLMKCINQSPYIKHLSMKIISLGPGYADMEITLGPDHYNPMGGIHGGVYASLIDSAAFWAAYCDLDEGVGLTSLDLKINYLAPARTGKILGRGKRLKMGKTVGLGECAICDEQGMLIAHGTSQLMAITPFQLLVPEDAGFLPPKFI